VTPAEHWRDLLRRSFPHLPRNDQDLLAYAESVEPASALERYLVAIVLLTYGRLDAAVTIFDNLPAPGDSARALVRVVDELVGPGADSLADPAATRAWIVAHGSSLRWSEAEGRFRP
jgi:hypothetical protein